MTPTELIGAIALVVLIVVFPALLIYGLLVGRVLTVVGTTPFQRILLRSTDVPSSSFTPWIASRLERPHQYWGAIKLYGVLSVFTTLLAVLLLLVRHAP
jgi:hypothetical protein